MRLLPTSGDDNDLAGSPRAPSPSRYQSEYEDTTPYVPINAHRTLRLFSDTFHLLPPLPGHMYCASVLASPLTGLWQTAWNEDGTSCHWTVRSWFLAVEQCLSFF